MPTRAGTVSETGSGKERMGANGEKGRSHTGIGIAHKSHMLLAEAPAAIALAGG